mmetsp:Transcript_11011/g.44952  ORF Transcript_11011/g.44952 Transcript_11011/m.44952 type:complete len:173 (-) Transcript_11011:210-728(-)
MADGPQPRSAEVAGVQPTVALRQPTRILAVRQEALVPQTRTGSTYVPESLFHAIHAAASRLVAESGDEHMFRTLRPSALYAVAVLAHEYILHVADLSIDDLDKTVADAFAEITAAEDDWILNGRPVGGSVPEDTAVDQPAQPCDATMVKDCTEEEESMIDGLEGLDDDWEVP